jgi:predicted O-methyltransferase YrrM
MTLPEASKLARLNELRQEKRHPQGIPETNYIGGLLDLIEYAKPKTVLEIGSYLGVSTEGFLLTCERVTAIDSWEAPYADAYESFLERVKPYANLTVVRGRSPQAIPQQYFDLCYVDGEHDWISAYDDISACQKLKPKWIAGHDYKLPGVAFAVHKLLGQPDKVFSDTSWIKKI